MGEQAGGPRLSRHLPHLRGRARALHLVGPEDGRAGPQHRMAHRLLLRVRGAAWPRQGGGHHAHGAGLGPLPDHARDRLGRPVPSVASVRSRLLRPSARRWLIVAGLFLVTCGMAIPLAAFGVFLPIVVEAFGWSRGAVSTALSINLLVGGLAGFGIGALADRFGPRIMLVLTVALAGSAFALIASVSTLWEL